jgi:hypothetical protein
MSTVKLDHHANTIKNKKVRNSDFIFYPLQETCETNPLKQKRFSLTIYSYAEKQ